MPDHLVKAFMVTDPVLVRKLKAKREKSPSAPRDEVWDGVYIVSPIADVEHQILIGEFLYVCSTLIERADGAVVVSGVNLSDRIENWKENYRIPDLAVFLPGNPATFLKAFVRGGPDLAVEILGKGDMARRKLDFYAKIGTRELLVLDRDPWTLELYRLVEGKLELVGISTPDKHESLTSAVLPLSLQLVPGESRPNLKLSRLDGGQSWRI